MNKRESYALLNEMLDADHYGGECRQLGNGEWVILINWTYIWSKADWKRYKKGKLTTLEAQEKVEVKA